MDVDGEDTSLLAAVDPDAPLPLVLVETNIITYTVTPGTIGILKASPYSAFKSRMKKPTRTLRIPAPSVVSLTKTSRRKGQVIKLRSVTVGQMVIKE
eukprot:gene45902-57218_t